MWADLLRERSRMAPKNRRREHQSGRGNHVMGDPLQTVLRTLADSGLLLKQDKRVPNVVTLLTGESLHTSWWSHPKAHLIFATLSELSLHPDVLFTKFLYRKVTLVHRNLRSVFLAVASANEPWQLRGLSTSARRLLAAVNESETPLRCSGKPQGA